jgi:hypothetical protein
MTINANAYETLKSRKNMVTVDVRPVELSPGQPARFEVRMNTHSVDLDYDMVAAGILKDNQGNEYRPTNWDGSEPGGHHRRGILAFPALEGKSKSVTLVIKSISNVDRTFKWELEP